MASTKRPSSKRKATPLQKFRSKPKFNLKIALVAIVFFISIGLYFLYASRAATPTNVGSDLCGTWVIQQVSSSSELNNYKTKINQALDVPGVVGLSVRFPWDAADLSGSQATNPLLDASRKMVDDYNTAHPGANKQLSIRFMAGRHVPARIFQNSAVNYYVINGSEKVGVPWGKSSTTTNYVANSAWLDEYDAYVAKLATWSRNNHVHLLHLSWWAQDWAELNHGKEVRAVAGYSKNNWLSGHKEIIDIGTKYSGNDLTVELPLSGYGPVADDMSPALADYIISKVGANSPRFFIQANGWGPNGEWGAPSADVEASFDRIWNKPIMRGLQMIQPEDYDWSKVYPRLTQNKATYAEVYLPSFALASQAQLKAEITDFGKTCSAPTPPPPPPTADTTNPVVTLTTPTNGSTVKGTATISANATDNVGVTKVNILVDNKMLSTDTTSPYSASWNSSTVSNGTHTVSAVAYDSAGNSATSTPATVTVNNQGTPPPPPPPPPTPVPDAPTGVHITPRSFATTLGISVSWQPVDNTSSYRLYRNGLVVQNPVFKKDADGNIIATDLSVKGFTGYNFSATAVSSEGKESAQSTSDYGRCDWFIWWFCK